MKKILMIVVLLTLALVGYRMFQPKDITTNSTTYVKTDVATNASTDATIISTDFNDIAPTYVDLEPTPESDLILSSAVNSPPKLPIVATPIFSCDGRQHCSQMTSCAEATYFVQHCPNTKMDGNNDGIPCEQQWCQ